MKINDCGINQMHPDDWSINRPHGSGDYLFIYTRTPINIFIEGKLCHYPSETIFLFNKGEEQHFGPLANVYADDFIHFDTTCKEDEELIKSLDIPSLTPLIGLDTSAMMTIHRLICYEWLSKDQYHQTKIDSLMRYFLIKLWTAIDEQNKYAATGMLRMQMNDLRSEIYSNVAKEWTIAGMAQRLSMSVSRFQTVYKSLFGRPAIEDVIFARIEKAKHYLKHSDYAISTIASLCGYENESHFSRQFKKITGATATQFRLAFDKSNENNNN